MEQIALYLFKSSVWLTAFAIVFLLFLRDERFFVANRIYLIAGILTALIFPLISIRYTVYLPDLSAENISGNTSGINVSNRESQVSGLSAGLIFLYISGAFLVVFPIVKQSRSVLKLIRRANVLPGHSVKLIRSNEYESSFSYFSYVFVNPSATDVEALEILNHEMVHVRQKHWFDLLLAELLCIIQWFNPMIWIYVRLIRQNHEYLADKGALQYTSDPVVYRATLLNQIVGSPVFLANSFGYSLNKKRFDMMKNIVNSPYRKLKVLLIMPVFAILLYSFAEPEYKSTVITQTSIKPLNPQEPISPSVITPQQPTSSKLSTQPTSRMFSTPPTVPTSPTPPTPASAPQGGKGVKVRTADGKTPIYVLDGKVTPDISSIDPNSIESMIALKDATAIEKYGDKAKDGLVEITLKKGVTDNTPGLISEVRVVDYGVQKTGDSTQKVMIRSTGFNTYSGSPIIFVDGVERGANIKDLNISPNDIETMTVLKGVSATKLYGKKAKSGVILITTKRSLIDFKLTKKIKVAKGISRWRY